MALNVGAIKEADCVVCGVRFTKRTARHKYCSDGCRDWLYHGPVRARWEVLRRDGFRCVYCGRSPLTSKAVELRVDHIVPHARGGRAHPGNLVTACHECNSAKSDEMLDGPLGEEFFRLIERRCSEFILLSDLEGTAHPGVESAALAILEALGWKRRADGSWLPPERRGGDSE